MKVVCINGMPRSGKDQFVEYCCDLLGPYGSSVSTVDGIKKIAKQCGWDGEKTPEARKGLADLKQALDDWLDYSYIYVMRHIGQVNCICDSYGQNEDKFVVFIHCREPEKIQRFKDTLGATAIILRRPQVEDKEQSNYSDSGVFNYNYDYVIDNSGSLEDLHNAAEYFCKEILKCKLD